MFFYNKYNDNYGYLALWTMYHIEYTLNENAFHYLNLKSVQYSSTSL